MKHLDEQGVTIFLNGNKVKENVAKKKCEKLDSKTMELKTASGGTKFLYIKTRD